MGIFSTITTQLGDLLRSQSVARRMMLMAVAVASIGGFIYLAMGAHTGGFVTLYGGMQPGEAAEALGKLRLGGIAARLEDAGTTLKVAQNQSDDAAVLLSMAGIPNNGIVGYEEMSKMQFGQSKAQQEQNFHRMREGELARTLLSIQEIERARVHLALPADTLFTRDQKRATASVVLKVRGGSKLEERQIRGIIHLVSHSVEGLAPEDVMIVDDMGNPLSVSQGDAQTQASAANMSYKTNYENDLRTRLESMLENVVGKNHVSARVTADLDFSTLKQTKQTFNPEGQDPIITSQKASSEGAGKGSAGSAAGVPGSGSNLPVGATGSVAPTPAPSAVGTTPVPGRSDMTTEFAVSRDTQEIVASEPKAKKVSVAVIVDGTYPESKPGDPKTAAFQARSPEEMAQIESIVKAAIGYSKERADVVTVACVPFKIDEAAALPAPRFSYETRRMIEQGVQWGIVGIIGLLVVLLVLRPAVKQIMVLPMAGQLQALPAGAAGEFAGQLPPGTTLSQSVTSMQPDGMQVVNTSASNAGPGAGGGAIAAAGPNGAAALSMRGGNGNNMTAEQMMNPNLGLDFSLEDLGSLDPSEALKRQHMAAHHARISQAQAQKVQKEVLETAKNDPKKTVGLLRQWMDEA